MFPIPHHPFQQIQFSGFQNIDISNNNFCFKHELGFSWIFKSILVSPKDKQNWFWEPWILKKKKEYVLNRVYICLTFRKYSGIFKSITKPIKSINKGPYKSPKSRKHGTWRFWSSNNTADILLDHN